MELNGQSMTLSVYGHGRTTKQDESPVTTRTVSLSEMLKWFEYVAKRYNPAYVIDDLNRDTIITLCTYFSRFSDSSLDKRKGVMITGTVGTGKTELMEIFIRIGWTTNRPMRMVNSYRMFMDMRIGGDQITGVYEELKKPSSKYELVIDDLGMDEPTKVYGAPMDFTNEMLYSRYDAFKRGVLTHATTNLNDEQLRTRLDYRTYDRVREMFNVITLNGKSRRV